MLADLRRSRIISTIRQKMNGFASVQELSQALGVSGMTIRRDLEYLENQSALHRVHGGAILPSRDGKRHSFRKSASVCNDEDQLLGRMAAGLVHSGERIILDGSPLMETIASNLSEIERLTIITNNLVISELLSRVPGVSIIFLGGDVTPEQLITTGETTKRALEPLSADKYFLSPASYSLQNGICLASQEEAELSQSMLQSAKEVILVAESSLYNRNSLFPVASLSQVQILITDDRFSDNEMRELETLGIKVITPGRNGDGLTTENSTSKTISKVIPGSSYKIGL